jgi:hypothetical protein
MSDKLQPELSVENCHVSTPLVHCMYDMLVLFAASRLRKYKGVSLIDSKPA